MIPTLTVKLELNQERRTPVGLGYSPHLVISTNGEYLGVRIVRCPSPITANASGIVDLALVYHPEVDYTALVPGTSFRIMEGPTMIGKGTVIQTGPDCVPPHENS